ncbi:testis-specific Y-encoded protein 3-like [Eschrichtius robustus]|uniref:testis-specific Y-encoded protein 3-like n=1 Tax=Eschrichtius robustus TaxID=9764 RepID=UPI0035C06330
MGTSGLGVACSSFLPPGHACLVAKGPAHAFQASSPQRLQGTIQSAAKRDCGRWCCVLCRPRAELPTATPSPLPQLRARSAWAGELAGIMQVFWLPVEDIMEEMEVVMEEEEQEQQEEQMLEEPGPSPKSAPSPLEALEAVQLELEPLNRECSRACARLNLRTLGRRKTYLEHRSTIIQSIPGFWVKVFVNHPQMSATMGDLDKDMLSYMTNLKVEKLRYPSDCCKIVLFFRNNRYFQNEVVVKEYLINVTGYMAAHSTRIQWHRHFKSEAYSRRHHSSSHDFFRWFCDHSFAGSSRIAEIISEDLWPNPLRYYPREEGTTGTEEPSPKSPSSFQDEGLTIKVHGATDVPFKVH